MAKLLKLRRGTTSQHSSFTGAEGEVTVDTTKDTLVVHDGSTAGGTPLAKEAGNIATATVGTNVTVTANNSTDETVYPVFVDGATGTQGIESDTGLTYNPSSGKLTATEFVGNIDAVDGDFDGTLEADAITVGGTALNTVIAGVTVSNATNAATFTTTANNSTNETVYPVFVDGATGAQGAETDTGLTYNPSTGLLTTAAITTTGNVTVGGNLQVNGTTTTVASSTMTVTDKNIEIAKGAANDAAADGAGITIDSGDGDKTWNWVDSTDAWTSSEHVHLGDSKKLLVGTSSDLTIQHDGSNSIIDQSTQFDLWIKHGSENMAAFHPDGGVDLYFNDALLFSTASYGAIIKRPSGGSTVLEVIGCEGQNAEINMASDDGDDNADTWKLKSAHVGNAFTIESYAGGSYQSVLKATDARTIELHYQGSARLATTNAGITVTGTVSDSKGDLRKIIQNSQSSAYTLVAADAGKHVIISSGGVTVPDNVFAAGDAVTIINNSGSDQTITQGSGVTMYNTADASTGNRTLAGRGMATLLYTAVDAVYISGSGLS